MYAEEEKIGERDIRSAYDPYDDAVIAKQPASKLPLSDQEKALVVLHETIDSLTRRLSAVLEPEHDAESATTPADPREGSPLREQLLANNRGINAASNRLRRLADRVEC